jgi:general secretion pathway protein C
MTARLLAFVIWAAVAATVVFWGLRLIVRSPAAPPHAVAATTPSATGGDLTRLLGDTASPAAPVPEASNRYRLVGVVAPREGGPTTAAIALIQVDDKPARPFRVGAVVDDPLVVQAVHRRGVSLGPSGGQPQVKLELPPLPVAATGSLPMSSPVAGTSPPPAAAPRPPVPVPSPVVPAQQVTLPQPVPQPSVAPVPTIPPTITTTPQVPTIPPTITTTPQVPTIPPQPQQAPAQPR